MTGSQAHYVLEKLIDEGNVSAAEVRRHLGGMWKEMNALQRRIAELRGFVAPAAHPVRAVKRAVKAVRKKTRKLSAETRAMYRLQGQYLGYMRQIPKAKRAKYKAMVKKDGREAAIAAMKKALGK